MSTTRRSDNERDKHLAETYGKLTKAVEELVRSEDWVQMLAVAARFHRYSPGNVCLILSQRATHPGSAAIELGRHSDAR